MLEILIHSNTTNIIKVIKINMKNANSGFIIFFLEDYKQNICRVILR